MRIAGAAVLVLLFGTILSPPGEAQWRTGVGGNAARCGQVACSGPLAPAVAWEGTRTALYAKQAVVADGLVIADRVESDAIPTGTWIVAHELATGAERWAVQLPYEPDGAHGRSRVCAIRDGHVYATRAAYDEPGYLYALDPADGAILWRSEAMIAEGTGESPTFAPNGDLIAGAYSALLRISHLDGSTVWTANRDGLGYDALLATVFGGRVYSWEWGGPCVTAFDLATGQRLYQSAYFGGSMVQQVGLCCGPDGTIYAPRSANNPATDALVALTDTGSALVEKWRVPLAWVPFATFAVGPDGSVYSYAQDTSDGLRILRLDPETGAALNESPPIPMDWPAKPRMAIDAEGHVYVTNGSYGQGALYAFMPDLHLLWHERVAGVSLGGPALAEDGTLIVCGTDHVRAYLGAGAAGVSDPPSGVGPEATVRLFAGCSNPCAGAPRIGFELGAGGIVALEIFDSGGRGVRHLLPPRFLGRGPHTLVWNACDDYGRRVPGGLYWVRLRHAGNSGSRAQGSGMPQPAAEAVEKLLLIR